jgi:transposase-like protein
MKGYPPAFIARVREDYITGKFKTLAELAKNHGLQRQSTVSNWIRKFDWKADRDKLLQRAQKRTNKRIEKELSEVRFEHSQMWRLVRARALAKLTPDAGVDRQEKIARILKMSQDGELLAMGEKLNTGEGSTHYTLVQIMESPEFKEYAENRVIDAGNPKS